MVLFHRYAVSEFHRTYGDCFKSSKGSKSSKSSKSSKGFTRQRRIKSLLSSTDN